MPSASPFQQLLEHVRTRREQTVKDIIGGMPKTMDEYKRLTGKIEALDDILDQAKEITGNPEINEEKDLT